MSITIDPLLAEAMALPNEVRALLADRLIESLGETPSGHFDEIWAVEARCRLDEVRKGRVSTISGDEVAAKIRHAASR